MQLVPHRDDGIVEPERSKKPPELGKGGDVDKAVAVQLQH
jgi:hypothetical protein